MRLDLANLPLKGGVEAGQCLTELNMLEGIVSGSAK